MAYTKGLNTKKTIFRAALVLFYEKGYQQVSVTEICEKAGITRNLFYRYYKDKNDIILAMRTVEPKYGPDFLRREELLLKECSSDLESYMAKVANYEYAILSTPPIHRLFSEIHGVFNSPDFLNARREEHSYELTLLKQYSHLFPGDDAQLAWLYYRARSEMIAAKYNMEKDHLSDLALVKIMMVTTLLWHGHSREQTDDFTDRICRILSENSIAPEEIMVRDPDL